MDSTKTFQLMTTHRTFALSAIAMVLLSIIFYACSSDPGPTGPVAPEPTTVEGTIYDDANLPLSGVEISFRPSFAPAETTLSDIRGNFKFVVSWPDTNSRGFVALTALKNGYYSKTDSFSIDAGKTYSKSYSLKNRSDTASPGESSSSIARLVFISRSATFAYVKGVGKRESVVLTFEARDSSDVPLDSTHRAEIAFRILPAINGGEKLSPETTKTSIALGNNGRVVTTLQSGKKAGILQVEAFVVDNPAINAITPAMPIYSGAPDINHFTVALEKLNFPALGFLGVQNKVTVQVGDKWGNPVPDSTAVYFTTSGGIIQPAALTDEVGIAQVTLSSGNSQPSNGFAWVYASTVGDSGKLVKDSIRVLFSGQPKVEPDNFDFSINDGGSIIIPFKVFDRNRNPLTNGTRITVTFSGDATSELMFSGDLDITMPDTQDSSFTSFRIMARDTVLLSPSSDKGFVMSINISSPSGNTLRSYVGILRGSGSVTTPNTRPSSIILTALSSNTISVHGTGQNETSILTFLVRDRSGRPVGEDSCTVNFTFVGPTGGASFFPTSVKTDVQGRVQTALASGTVAGVVQVVASVDTGGINPLTSGPVAITIAGGLPDQNHFTLAVQKLNIPGLVTAGVTDGMTVYVGDKYGNPVQPNTAVYFTTTGGYVEASAFTNNVGIASVNLRSAQPDPPDGIATVTATTIDSSGNTVQNSAMVVFSGHPIITTSDASFLLADDSSVTIWFGVQDLNDNPLSAGNIVTVSVSGKHASEVQLSGDLSTTIPDALYGGYRIDTFYVNIADKVANSLLNGEVTLTINVSGPNGTTALFIPGVLLPTRNPKIKSLPLMTNVPRELSISGLGELDSVSLVYQIKDSLDHDIHRAGEFVTFEVTSGRSGYFMPSFVLTDEHGKARTTFFTDKTIDTVTFVAKVKDIVSTPKTIFIRPGSPYRGNGHILVSRTNDTIAKVNFPQRLSSSEQLANLRIRVTDRYGNVVKERTQIQFVTDAGEILAPSFTDAYGYATGNWYGGPVVPENNIATLKAIWTNGVSTVLLDSTSVVYSGKPVISGGLPPNTILPAGLDWEITYRVRDLKGLPLAESTKIFVSKFGTAENSIKLTGDTIVYMADTRDTSKAKFTFHITDTNTTISKDRVFGIKIKVTGQNGDAELVVADTLKGKIPPPSNAKFLALVDISQSRLSVTGVGGVETTSLTYELQDSAGQVVAAPGQTVTFDFTGQQGGFNPSSASTDNDGRVTTTFFTGTIAETVRVFANMGRVTSSKQDIFVQAGPPSRSYFNLMLTKTTDTIQVLNFPGRFNSSKKIGNVRVSLGDRYGNPVANNTKVAFYTNGGTMIDTGYTRNGAIKIDWFGGLPFPSGPQAQIVASTIGQNSQLIVDSVSVIYSGQAQVSGGITEGYVFRQGIDTTLYFTVSDTLGNPLSQGTTITVLPSGPGSSSLVFSGDMNVTLPDNDDPLGTTFRLNIRDTNTTVTVDKGFFLEIRVGGPNGNATQHRNAVIKGIVLPPPPRVAGLQLVQVSDKNVSVKGGGQSETSLFTYQIIDSIGNPISKAGVAVTVSGIGVPFSFTPDTAFTDSKGVAQLLFHSDTVAGIAQITGRTGVYQSISQNIVISGGVPSQKYFTLLLTRPGKTQRKYNYPGAMPINQIIGEAQVQVGDRYGNPVHVGTPITFTTNAGLIGSSSSPALTDENGFVTVNWRGGDANLPPGGVAVVTARTLGEGGTDIWVADSAVVTYSGQVMINGGPAQDFQMPGASTYSFSFVVRDANGNPPAEGARIVVSATGTGANALVFSGDYDVTMPDTRDTALSRFTVTVTDTTSFSTTIRSLGFTIAVSGPNGSVSQSTSGTLLTTGGGRSRLPGSIALISTSSNDIQVAGTGGTETSTMVYEIRDSLGIPVDSAYKVVFSLAQSIGGAFISPDTGYCDPHTGRISSVIHSGTVSGPIQVIAKVLSSSGTISSNPVRILIHAGQPDQAHLSMSANPTNIPGLAVNGKTSTITVFLGDRYGNPVPEGTVIYLSSDIGIVTAGSGTDANGRMTATLTSTINPIPVNGFGYVRASTIGANGQTITDSLRILFSGAPIIDSLVTTPSNVTDFTARFRVYDVNHNPLAEANTVSVTYDGQVSVFVSRVFPSGNIPDTQDSLWTDYAVNFNLNRLDNPLRTGPFTATITVTGPNGTAVKTFEGRVDTSAPPGENVYGVRLVQMSSRNITVHDAGGVDVATLVFEVTDSLNRRIQKPGVEVAFSHEGISGYFTPETTITDINGQVYTTFHSGTVAGTVNIIATEVSSGISSNPERLTIVGGKASQQYFTLQLSDYYLDPKNPSVTPISRYNFPGAFGGQQYIGQARVLVGDKYGNPVPQGTAIYFTTNAGVIIGSDVTDNHGLATSDWVSGNPIPANGIATVKAAVLGEFGLVQDSVWAVYSGQAIISGGLPDGFTLNNGIDTVITFRITDANGNPIARGSTVRVTLSGDAATPSLDLTGAVNVVTPETRDTNQTYYSVRLRDRNTTVTQIRDLAMTITVTGPNGSDELVSDGYLRGTGSSLPPGVSGIRFISNSNPQITVKNGGGVESSLLTFEIIDSVGNTLALAGQPITFINQGVAGFFSAETVLTNINGRVQILFSSDTLAGIAEIIAQTAGGQRSSPVNVVITGGKPNANYFTFFITKPSATERKVNYPGALSLGQQIGTANVQLGDKFGNIVPPGTNITFGTNAGTIQGSASTNSNGFASVSWIGGSPNPPGGLAIISATVLSDNGTLTVYDTVVYSDQVLLTGGPTNGFQINGTVPKTFTFTLADINGNPIAEGSNVIVTATGTAAATTVLSGDINVTTIDTKDPAETQFSFTVRDYDNTSRIPRSLQLGISISGPNGSASLNATGVVLPVGAGDTTRSRLPGSIAFLSVNPSKLQVAGTGGTETSSLLFEIRDSLGIPVDSAYQVQFFFSNSPGGGEFITPSIGYCDSTTGQISAILHSGIRSGVIQLRAGVVTPTDTIYSEVVKMLILSGLPDQNFFTVYFSTINLPGLVYDGRYDTVTTLIGDKYGNPVQAGTAVYFTTNIGVVTSSTGFTDSLGFASVLFFSGNPRGTNGFGYVRASTVGENGVTVTDSARMLFSGSPIITYTGSPTFTIHEGESISFDFTVDDVYGNPISRGATIEIKPVTTSQYQITTPYRTGDTQSQGLGKTQFVLTFTDTVENPPIDGPVEIRIKITWEGNTFEQVIATGSIIP